MRLSGAKINLFDRFSSRRSTFVIGRIEPEGEIPASPPRDGGKQTNQYGIENEGEAVAVRMERIAEEIDQEGADHHGEIIHGHDARQGERRRTGRSDGCRLVVDDGLHHAIADTGKQGSDGEEPAAAEDPEAKQPQRDGEQRNEVDAGFQTPDDAVDEEPRKHDGQEGPARRR